jgi:hypothetical protein
MSGLPFFRMFNLKHRRPMRTIGTTSSWCMRWPFMTMALSACNGQAQEHPGKHRGTRHARSTQADTPKTEVRVNKEYDANGNVIAYDSTYSSFYSSHNADPAMMDSLFRDFEPRFNRRFPLMNDPGFNDLFFRDTLLYPDFFHDDFFRKRMEMNDRWMQQMMAEMDSMKNAYFRERAAKPPQPERHTALNVRSMEGIEEAIIKVYMLQRDSLRERAESMLEHAPDRDIPPTGWYPWTCPRWTSSSAA